MTKKKFEKSEAKWLNKNTLQVSDELFAEIKKINASYDKIISQHLFLSIVNTVIALSAQVLMLVTFIFYPVDITILHGIFFVVSMFCVGYISARADYQIKELYSAMLFKRLGELS